MCNWSQNAVKGGWNTLGNLVRKGVKGLSGQCTLTVLAGSGSAIPAFRLEWLRFFHAQAFFLVGHWVRFFPNL